MSTNNLLIKDCVIEDALSEFSVFIDPNQNSDDPPIRDGILPLYSPIVFEDNEIRGGFFMLTGYITPLIIMQF